MLFHSVLFLSNIVQFLIDFIATSGILFEQLDIVVQKKEIMKSDLILNLITAHNSGREAAFSEALNSLANDEEKKGNAALALSIRETYQNKQREPDLYTYSPSSTLSFVAQSADPLPKDRDNTLDLIEIVHPTVNLSDVALSEQTESTLKQVIEEQKQTEQLLKSGIVPTNRIIFCGPPGCGKTMTATALAKELGLEIAYVKLDGLVSSYLGQTGVNIRKIFEFVKNKRIMLFLDEFDAIAKKRDDTHELGELKRIVTTLLQNMDAMTASVFLVAATNHQQLLDPAVWRRFDLSIFIDNPDLKQRTKIISCFIKEHLSVYEPDEKTLITLTEGMSGSAIVSFMQSLAKFSILHKSADSKLTVEDICRIWLSFAVPPSGKDDNGFIKALTQLQKNGITIRTLEAITGIPKSTLSYRMKKEECHE